MPPSWVYWPTVVSSRNRGTAQVTTNTRYGTRNAPELTKYATMQYIKSGIEKWKSGDL